MLICYDLDNYAFYLEFFLKFILLIEFVTFFWVGGLKQGRIPL